MKKLKVEELRKKSKEDLKKDLITLEHGLMNAYGMMGKEQAKNNMAAIRKNIARIKTLIREMEMKEEIKEQPW